MIMSSINKLRVLLGALLIATGGLLWGQTATIGKWQPGLSFTHKFDQRWSANFTAGGLYALSAFDREDPDIPGLRKGRGKAFCHL
ncbi:MAG: hypothetical protein U5L96_12845 [Owenweeksia sp.]|nr:hypothetical protein [Owenweeksia sp.]